MPFISFSSLHIFISVYFHLYTFFIRLYIFVLLSAEKDLLLARSAHLADKPHLL
jgi:hypothetical protein